MIAAPPRVPVATGNAQTTVQPAVQPTGLQRVYVDGRHHLSSDLQQTVCGLQTSKADVVKPGEVECSVCRDRAEVQP